MIEEHWLSRNKYSSSYCGLYSQAPCVVCSGLSADSGYSVLSEDVATRKVSQSLPLVLSKRTDGALVNRLSVNRSVFRPVAQPCTAEIVSYVFGSHGSNTRVLIS